MRTVITLDGRKAEVDADQVNLILKKEELVAACLNLQKYIKSDPINHAYAQDLLTKNVASIRRLNKRIRPTVRFLGV